MPPLSLLDFIAIGWFLFAWLGFNALLDISPLRYKTLTLAMDEFRRGWMLSMAAREVRIMDTAIMSGLQQGTAFFASTSLFAIGGCFALFESTDRILQIAGDLSLPAGESRALWEIKVLGLLLIFAYAFFKFGWAYRLFNYASILMGAMPERHLAPAEKVEQVALQAAEMIVLAGKHFNRGQRAFFFAIGFLGWFAGPLVLCATTLAVLLVMIRRQFLSKARKAALSGQYPFSPAARSGE